MASLYQKLSDGTRDISNMSDEEYRDHIRRLGELYSSPCYYCQENCSDYRHCDAYHGWADRILEARKIERRNKKRK